MDLLRSTELAMHNIFEKAELKSPKSAVKNLLVIFDSGKPASLKSFLKDRVDSWQLESIKPIGVSGIKTENENIYLIALEQKKDDKTTPAYGQARDAVGAFWRTAGLDESVHIHFIDVSESAIEGALVGIGLASYNFRTCLNSEKITKGKTSGKKIANKNTVDAKKILIHITRDKKEINKDVVDSASAIFQGMNLSRHLSNMSGGVAHAPAICDTLKAIFKSHRQIKISVLDDRDLKKQGFGLLYHVGLGSEHGARLLKISYTPKKSSSKKDEARIALVGKGVTFDTGGLDLKPSSSMRWMKKDMSGAATVAGLCYFVSRIELDKAVDFYLPLAENAVSELATRPGDIHKSYSGTLVEIDNTDAEGRLVMSDAISYALDKNKNAEVSELIDISTLTGAMRVAVGLDVCGFFTNKDKLADKVMASAQQAGELAWRLPLVDKYRKLLKSNFADLKNSADGGYGGAITAALFLEHFVGATPWIHFDVMSWNGSADGAMSDGGNAQTFQLVAKYLLS